MGLFRFRRKKTKIKEPEVRNFNILRVATLGVCPTLDNLDVYLFNGQQFTPLATNICLDEALSSFFKSKFPSYHICENTQKLLINDTDAAQFVNNVTEIVAELSEALNTTPDNATLHMLEHVKKRPILIQPTGINGLLHRTQIIAASAGSATHAVAVTASSHLSGLTGISLLSANPMLFLTIPTTGAIFFAAGERVFANTPVGAACGITRDVLLIPMSFTQALCNHFFVGPIFRKVGIDAPLNLTSYLKFGAGIKAADSLPGRRLVSVAATKLIKILSALVEN